ncbi:MAG: DNA recombination protein RmuC [Negativicutes bacterium]|nr:DNA recombination protein RmuC [Negativicutes bacterium]
MPVNFTAIFTGLVLVLIVLTIFILWRLSIIAQLTAGQERLERAFRDELARSREEALLQARSLREELQAAVNRYNETVSRRMAENFERQFSELREFNAQQRELIRMNDQRLDKLREAVEQRLQRIQEENSQKLEQMRQTVDEKLHATLEQRLGESFKLVCERLEAVHQGLGEMQTLANGVGDLKRVLSSVKTRGIWGEIHLANIIDEIFTPDQYDKNVATKKGSDDRVEFAIRLPGRDSGDNIVWLPIDAKFPQEDYQRLLDAQEQADPVLAAEAGRALENRVKNEARDIRSKYLDPPHTTDFAIMFLPTEGLFAEVLRRPGLTEALLREQRVVVTGPTTLAALLNSVQVGFRTLAIEKRTSEVWSLLGAVKTEFGRFGDLLDKTQKKLSEASNTIEDASRRSRAIARKLKDVQQLPAAEAAKLLGSLSDDRATGEE